MNDDEALSALLAQGFDPETAAQAVHESTRAAAPAAPPAAPPPPVVPPEQAALAAPGHGTQPQDGPLPGATRPFVRGQDEPTLTSTITGRVPVSTGAPAPAVVPQPSADAPDLPETIRRFATKAAGFGVTPVLEAGAETLASKLGLPGSLPPATYAENHARVLARNSDAEAAHPIGAAIGSGLGMAATAIPAMLTGGATAALPAAGEAIAAPTVLGAAGRAAATNAVEGAVAGAGNAIGEGKDLPGVLSDAATSGTIGAALGGGASLAGAAGAKLARKIIADAPERAKQWVVKTFVGDKRGYSLPAAKKALAKDEAGVIALTEQHPEILKLGREAEHNDRGAVEKLHHLTSDLLDETTAPRPELYSKFAKALPEGGVTAGELAQHLEDRIGELHATGHGTDRDLADTLKDTLNRVKTAKNLGGGRPMFDPSKLSEEDRGILALYEKQQFRNPTPERQAAIDAVKASASSAGFDPNHIVTPLQLRGLTTDAQNTAYQRAGGIFGTERFTRAKAAAAPLEEFLDKIKERAAVADPASIAAIDAMDSKISSLLRIKAIAGQRLEKATENAMGTATPARGLSGMIHRASHDLGPASLAGGALVAAATGNHHVALALGLPAAVKSVGAARRMIDEKIAAMPHEQRMALLRLVTARQQRSLSPAVVQDAIRKGLPKVVVMSMVRGAMNGGDDEEAMQ